MKTTEITVVITDDLLGRLRVLAKDSGTDAEHLASLLLTKAILDRESED
jgi:hypothetical protein